MTRTVLIYRSRLLPISETFIRDHYDSLTHYAPVLAGLREIDGISTRHYRRILLEDHGIKSKIRIAAFKQFGWGRRFLSDINDVKPDLIHAHFSVDGADMVPVAQRLNIPLIVTLHGYDITLTDEGFKHMGPEGYIYLQKRAHLFAKADRFLPVSRFIQRQAIERGIQAEKTTLHYLGIHLDKFPVIDHPRDNAILYVGRLVEKKGLDLLIEAMARAGANENGTILRIIGDGPKREQYLALAKSKLKNHEYLGAQPHQRVIDELSKARIFSMPSLKSKHGDQEGLGLTYLEASAMGLPNVAFSFAGTKEAVIHGETGLLAPLGDVDALVENLKLLMQDKALCLKLGQQGRKYVERHFNQRRNTQNLEKIYDDVIRKFNT